METQHEKLKELSPEEINDVLDQCSHAHLGCRKGREVYVVPLTYVREGDSIYCHSRPGKKIDMMRAHPDVCLQVEQVRSSFSWRSVIAWGKYEKLTGIEAARAMRLLVGKIAEIESEYRVTPLELEIEAILKRAVIYAIRIKKATGRSEGFPWIEEQQVKEA